MDCYYRGKFSTCDGVAYRNVRWLSSASPRYRGLCKACLQFFVPSHAEECDDVVSSSAAASSTAAFVPHDDPGGNTAAADTAGGGSTAAEAPRTTDGMAFALYSSDEEWAAAENRARDPDLPAAQSAALYGLSYAASLVDEGLSCLGKGGWSKGGLRRFRFCNSFAIANYCVTIELPNYCVTIAQLLRRKRGWFGLIFYLAPPFVPPPSPRSQGLEEMAYEQFLRYRDWYPILASSYPGAWWQDELQEWVLQLETLTPGQEVGL